MGYRLSIHPVIWNYGDHDSSALLLEDNEVVFAAEEERFNRQKHATRTFPEKSIENCLNHASIGMEDVEKVYIPWKPGKKIQLLPRMLSTTSKSRSLVEVLWGIEKIGKRGFMPYLSPFRNIRDRLEKVWGHAPEIESFSHHKSHAASVFPFRNGRSIGCYS